MPYDPTLPATNSTLSSAVMRSQFNGLKDIIDAVPVLDAATVDSTATLPAGSPAQASVSVVGNALHFTFQIPQGDNGQPGSDGGAGPVGPQGPPFAQALVDGVTTLNPGDLATVSVVFDGMNVRFTFGIPRGATGAQGAPGELSQAALDAAIAGTSSNSNAVSPLSTIYPDPAMEEMRAKINELIQALRR